MTDAINQLQKCVSIVKAWMTENKLKLNGDKTEVLYIASPHFLNHLNFPVFNVDENPIVASPCARNIGVLFNKKTVYNTSHKLNL